MDCRRSRVHSRRSKKKQKNIRVKNSKFEKRQRKWNVSNDRNNTNILKKVKITVKFKLEKHRVDSRWSTEDRRRSKKKKKKFKAFYILKTSMQV